MRCPLTDVQFGPTLIRDIGFTKEQAALLNSPFGALQSLTICAGAYLAQRFKMKGIILGIMTLPVLAGVAMLFVANSAEERDRTTALAGYYMMAFLFAGNPLIVSWMVANTGGQTKKSVILSFYNAFNATGSIIGTSPQTHLAILADAQVPFSSRQPTRLDICLGCGKPLAYSRPSSASTSSALGCSGF